MIRSLTGSFEPLPLARSPRASSSSPPPGDPDLFDYDSRFESTHRPCDLLWGPGDPAMPCSGSPVTIPRQTRSRPSTACSRSNTTATGSPSCAAQAPRRRLGPATGRHLVPDPGRHAVPRLQPSASPARRRARKAGEGDCQVCPAEILGNGGLPDMLRLAARLGADVPPRPVQTARLTMSRMPTCNRIVRAATTSHPTTRAWQGSSPTRPAPRPERLLRQFPLTFVSQTCWTGLDSGAPIGHVRGSDVQD